MPDTPACHFADSPTVLAALATLVQKDGVSLGGLTPAQLAAALGLAACTVPADAVLREAEVNAALQRALGETCSFLGTDHVELRRWLIDAGWLRRDGFGRAYQRVAMPDLSPAQAQIAVALNSVDPVGWTSAVREQWARLRAQRKTAWMGRQSRVAPAPGAESDPDARGRT
ncbi:MAG: DUF2087 domain-containing protein [Rhizobacter sp.]|nr:DUF2087 domain-containing protein [Rhizobacter sp.]